METTPSKRVLRNFGIVLRGRGLAAIFNLAATALMAHALSAVEFGLVILLHTYVLAVRGILNFRTFEAIVKFAFTRRRKQLGTILRAGPFTCELPKEVFEAHDIPLAARPGDLSLANWAKITDISLAGD